MHFKLLNVIRNLLWEVDKPLLKRPLKENQAEEYGEKESEVQKMT